VGQPSQERPKYSISSVDEMFLIDKKYSFRWKREAITYSRNYLKGIGDISIISVF
jgi:hypothetical protein